MGGDGSAAVSLVQGSRSRLKGLPRLLSDMRRSVLAGGPRKESPA